MASKIHSAGAIKVNVVAKSADFGAGMSKIEKRLIGLKKVGKGVGAALKKAFNPKVLLGGLLSTAGFSAALKSSAKFGSDLSKKAKEVGVATEEIRDFMTLMEGDNIGADKVMSTLTRANKRRGDIENEMRGPLTKLEKSGLSEDIIGRAMDAATDKTKDLIDVFNEFGKVAAENDFSQSQVASWFDALAGEDGRKIGAWVVQAVEAHGDLRKAMDEAGRFETTTGEEYASLEKLDQKFLEIGKNIKDFMHKAMGNIAEPLSNVIDDVNKWLLGLKNDPDFATNITDALKDVGEGFLAAFELAKKILEVIEKIMSGFDRFMSWWQGNKDESLVKAANAEFNAQGGKDTSAPSYGQYGGVGDLANNADGGRFGGGLTWVGERGPELVDFNRPGMIYSNEKLRSAMGGGAMSASIGSLRNASRGISIAGVSGSNSAADVSNETVENIQRMAPALVDMNSALRTFIDDAKSFKDIMRDMGQSILDNLLERTLAPVGNRLNTVMDGFLSSILPFADGGKARRGLALVGERGPEVVDFSRPGMVYSNEQMRSAFGGGGGVSVTYNIQSTDGPGVQAALVAATPAIVNQAQAAVADRAARPGGFRQQIRGRA